MVKPEPTALAMAISSAQSDDVKRNAGAKLDRKKRVFYVPENYVLQLLSRGLARHNVIMVPEPLGLPDTASVVGIWSDWSRNAFAVVVYDKSFDDVPEGEAIPEIKIDWSYARIAIADHA